MERLLIVGADTAAGANIALALSDRFEVFGAEGPHSPRAAGFNRLADWAQDLAGVVTDCRPQWTIYCGQLSLPSWSAPSTVSGQRELETVSALAAASDSCGASLTLLSSDGLFCGPRMFHEEDWPASAQGPFADCARSVEQCLASSRALTVRTHAYGWSAKGGGYAESFWASLTSGLAVEADGERHATPILASDLAELLARAYQRGAHGVMHICGAERTSPYRFAAEMAQILGVQLPERRSESASGNTELCMGETSLNTLRARRMLDMPMPMLREGLGHFVQQAHSGWRERLQTVGQLDRFAAVAA